MEATTHRRLIAESLRARAPELAEALARRLIADHPGLESRYAPLPVDKWSEHYLGRLCDLAAAIDADSPPVFAAQVGWAKAAFSARGVPISDLSACLETLAAVLPAELDPSDAGLIHTFLAAGREVLHTPPETPCPALSVCTPQGRLGGEYLLALFEGDRLRAASIVLDAVKNGLSVQDAYLNVFAPVQREVGRMWHLGEISVAEEHFATATTQIVMSQVAMLAVRRPPNGFSVLAASPELNSHELGIRIVADFFEFAGWRVIFLGCNIPAADIARAAIEFNVDLVALSAMLPTHLCPIEDAIRQIRELCAGSPRPRIIVGGKGFECCPSVWKNIGADGCAMDAISAVQLGASLVGNS